MKKGRKTIGERIKEQFHQNEYMNKRVQRKAHKKDNAMIRLETDQGDEIDVPYKTLVDLMKDAGDLYGFPWVGVISLIILIIDFGLLAYLTWLINQLIQVLEVLI